MAFLRPINNWTRMRHYWLVAIMSAGAICLPLTSSVSAINTEEQLLHAGLDLFPRFIAADQGLSEKTGTDGQLLLVLVHNTKAGAKCDKAAHQHLENITRIRNFSVRIKVVANQSLPAYENKAVAGIFLCGHQDHQLKNIMNFANKKHALVFSPFIEDVEAGAHGGITLTDRILPVINIKTLAEAKILLKPFFLRIAKTL